jgi:hypothetical protein
MSKLRDDAKLFGALYAILDFESTFETPDWANAARKCLDEFDRHLASASTPGAPAPAPMCTCADDFGPMAPCRPPCPAATLPAVTPEPARVCKYCSGRELRSVCVKCGRAPGSSEAPTKAEVDAAVAFIVGQPGWDKTRLCTCNQYPHTEACVGPAAAAVTPVGDPGPAEREAACRCKDQKQAQCQCELCGCKACNAAGKSVGPFCECFHAPEQHGPTGCTVDTLMNGPCACKYDGSKPAAEPPGVGR